MKESVNYIVAGYPGPHSHHKYLEYHYGDCIVYHLIELSKYKNNIDTITLVINNYECDNLVDKKRFFNFIAKYKQIYANVDIIFRKNEYISYGGFLHAFENRKKDYDKYILMEYDYSFCVDDFDKKLSDLQNHNNLDVMFAAWEGLSIYPEHGLISLGILTHASLEKTISLYKEKMKLDQFLFTRAFLDAGFKCGDWRNKYRIDFYHHKKNSIMDYSTDIANETIVTLLQRKIF